MRVTGYHISNNTIVSTDNEIFSDGEACFESLLQPKEDTIRMLYHLEYSVASLLRMARISRTAGQELLYTTSLTTRPYRLRYIQGKFFSIKRTGAFAYFSNSGQYANFPNEWLLKDASELAGKAQEVGYRVLDVLKELGIDATSLTNPYRAYERTPVPVELARLMEEETDKVKQNVMRGIAIGLLERDLKADRNDGHPLPITLDVAIKENRWDDLGKLNGRR
jgi:hypothetical protein